MTEAKKVQLPLIIEAQDLILDAVNKIQSAVKGSEDEEGVVDYVLPILRGLVGLDGPPHCHLPQGGAWNLEAIVSEERKRRRDRALIQRTTEGTRCKR